MNNYILKIVKIWAARKILIKNYTDHQQSINSYLDNKLFIKNIFLFLSLKTIKIAKKLLNELKRRTVIWKNNINIKKNNPYNE